MLGEKALVGSFQIQASRAKEPLFYSPPAPDGMTPFPFQEAGVEYMLSRRNGLFGDAPGLGKSAECVLLGNAIEAKRTLVICPASLRLNWEREIWAWSTLDGASTHPVIKASDGIDKRAHFNILSYDLLRNDHIVEALMGLRWDHLILDEAHYLKDPGGNKRTKSICAPDLLPSVVGRITMASGTILPNQPAEAYNCMRLLAWESIDRMSLESFRKEYYGLGGGFVNKRVFDPKTRVWKYKAQWSTTVRNQPKNLDDLQMRLRKHIMVRRLKEDVLPQLPERLWHPFPLVADSGIRNALKHPGWEQARKLYEMGGFVQAAVDGQISEARRLLGEAKAKHVIAYVKDMLESGVEKVVIGAWHRSVLEALREGLDSYGLVYMDGGTSLRQRQDAVDRFQGRPEVRVILGQTQVLGLGWTLTASQDVVLAEPDWVPGVNDQLLDRVHRIGAAVGGRVIGHIPVVPGTLDERILGAAAKKDKNNYLALDKLPD